MRWVVPQEFFGACIDGHEAGDTARIFTASNVARMRSAGFGCLSYRLRTELAGEAWHWNPRGAWSSPHRSEGYFVGSQQPGEAIRISFGYRLPRRGNTKDQAAGCGYSRLDDGDLNTFWKSNPYLDTCFTHEDASVHPQWAALDFGRDTPIDAVTLAWGEPHAVHYQVQYWRYASPKDTDESDCGEWICFPRGDVRTGHGGTVTLRLAGHPIRTRFLRILMWTSAYAGPPAKDPRDRVGFAIREIRAGTLSRSGRLRDAVRHAPSARLQTEAFVSSTDPWCRAADRNPNSEQPGLDLAARSGVVSGARLLVPVSVLYGNPDDAAAEVAYLVRRGYSIGGVELGEEPDHQYVAPEDYGALYLQFARAIHASAPGIPVGGPSLESVTCEVRKWPSPDGPRSWIAGFVAYLKRRGCLGELQFFSFEWYPFDEVHRNEATQLLGGAGLLQRVWRQLASDGVPARIPWYVTEYGYSAFACRQEVDVAGALFTAQTMCGLLRLGASGAYFFGLEPNTLIAEGSDRRAGGSWGNNLLWMEDGAGRATQPVAAYWACRLVTRAWATPAKARLAVYPVEVRAVGPAPSPRGSGAQSGCTLEACALRRPGGGWSLLFINLDRRHPAKIRLQVRDAVRRGVRPLMGRWEILAYGRGQYVWRECGQQSHPVRNRPPARRMVRGPVVTVGAYSMAIVRQAAPMAGGSGRIGLKNFNIRR
ncbi:MAG: hypothetical protein ACP5VE_08795 [Chthonomonadales bacterium]